MGKKKDSYKEPEEEVVEDLEEEKIEEKLVPKPKRPQEPTVIVDEVKQV